MEVDDLVKTLGQSKVVDVARLELGHGELLSVLGPSGSGKSTLLRLCAGLESPDHGTVRFEGVDHTHEPPERRPVNMVFQSYALFPHMDVRGNVEYGPRAARLPEAEVRERAAQVTELVGLSGLEDRRPGQLSGGQQQRVALARALAMRPKALLLDEPLSALDMHLRAQVRDHLCGLQSSLGISMVLVTHDQAEAMAVSQRLALMSEGRIVQVGRPEEIYDSPVDVTAAEQVGRMSFIRANGGHEGSLHRLAAGLLPRGHPGAGPDGSFGLRPEQVSLSSGGDQKAVRTEATIERVEFSGGTQVATLRCPDGTSLLSSLPRGMGARAGDRVTARWGLADMHVFGADGKSLGRGGDQPTST